METGGLLCPGHANIHANTDNIINIVINKNDNNSNNNNKEQLRSPRAAAQPARAEASDGPVKAGPWATVSDQSYPVTSARIIPVSWVALVVLVLV